MTEKKEDLVVTMQGDAGELCDRIADVLELRDPRPDEVDVLKVALFRLAEDLQIVRQDQTGAMVWVTEPRADYRRGMH